MHEIKKQSGYRPATEVVKALRFLLRPLVKLMLNHQITYPFIIKLLKETYVEIAEHEYKINRKKQTDSRISLITGVHRKDVKALRGSRFNYEDELPAGVTLGGQLVARWCADEKYTDEQGKPLPLPRLGKNKISFESLVRLINKDIRPRSILDEFIRLNIVHVCDDDNVWLHEDALISDEGIKEKAFYLGLNLHDHIAACTHNMAGLEPSMLERCLYYDKLTPEDVETLAAEARKMGVEMLLALNNKALELQKNSKGQIEANKRINFGLYFMRGEMSDFYSHHESEETNKTKIPWEK